MQKALHEGPMPKTNPNDSSAKEVEKCTGSILANRWVFPMEADPNVGARGQPDDLFLFFCKR